MVTAVRVHHPLQRIRYPGQMARETATKRTVPVHIMALHLSCPDARIAEKALKNGDSDPASHRKLSKMGMALIGRCPGHRGMKTRVATVQQSGFS
jgi:hypothetical protein